VLLSTPLHASSNFTVSVQLANKRGLKKTHYNTRSRETSVGMTICYELDGRTSIAGGDNRLLLTLQNTDTPSLITNAYLGLFSQRGGGVFQGHEADHAPPTSAEIKDGAAITLLPHMTSWRDP
jgi:hypothetical protein